MLQVHSVLVKSDHRSVSCLGKASTMSTYDPNLIEVKSKVYIVVYEVLRVCDIE